MGQFNAKIAAENKIYYLKAGDRRPVLELELYDADGVQNELLVGRMAVATVSGSTNLNVGSTLLPNLAVGQHIVGTGIPEGTTVAAFLADSLTMSAAATISASGGSSPTLDFLYPASLVVAGAVGGRRLIDEAAMTPSGVSGARTVSYTWAGSELLLGEYLMEVIANLGLANQESFPRNGFYKLKIVPHL